MASANLVQLRISPIASNVMRSRCDPVQLARLHPGPASQTRLRSNVRIHLILASSLRKCRGRVERQRRAPTVSSTEALWRGEPKSYSTKCGYYPGTNASDMT